MLLELLLESSLALFFDIAGKVDAILKMLDPKDIHELKSLQGKCKTPQKSSSSKSFKACQKRSHT